MLNRLILKVTEFQLLPPKRLGTVVKNILGGIMAPAPCQRGLTTAINNQINRILSIVYKVHSLSADLNRKFVQRSVNGILKSVLG